MEARAKLRYARLSPQKTRLVVDMVRGKQVQDALNILKFSPQKAAAIVSKLVSSAVANAEQKGVADVDRLYVKTIMVDQRCADFCRVPRGGPRGFVNLPVMLPLFLTKSKYLRR